MLRRVKSCRLPVASCELALIIGLASAATAGVLPDQLGTVAKGASSAVKVPDQALFDEYGFDAGEQVQYGPLSVSYWRFKDSTGAMAAFQDLRPSDAKPSKLDKLAVTFPKGAVVAHGNYVFRFDGRVPTEAELVQIDQGLPKLEQSPLPVLSSDLPANNLVPNSERYLLGPVSLGEFDPGIPPSAAAFHLSAEAQYGRYHTKDGDLNLAIFNYPTPGIARDRADAFAKLQGAVVKRAGPLVAVIMNAPNADAAERLLAEVSYNSSITWDQQTPQKGIANFAKAILSMFVLAGIIIGFCLFSGLAFAGFKILSRRRFGTKDAEPEMITLHLGGK